MAGADPEKLVGGRRSCGIEFLELGGGVSIRRASDLGANFTAREGRARLWPESRNRAQTAALPRSALRSES